MCTAEPLFIFQIPLDCFPQFSRNPAVVRKIKYFDLMCPSVNADQWIRFE